MRLIFRLPLKQNLYSIYGFKLNSRYLSHKKDDSNESQAANNEQSQEKVTSKNKEALKKLHILLKEMIESSPSDLKGPKLDLAKPKKKYKIKKEEVTSKQSVEKEMISAAKDVAESLGGNTKQTESELLIKLLNSTGVTPSTPNLIDVIKDMKVDRGLKGPEQQSRAQQVRQILERMKTTKRTSTQVSENRERVQRRQTVFESQIDHEPIDLFGNEPLGIFEIGDTKLEDGLVNKTWQKLYEKELKLAVTHPPSNYFQEMILWTEQGKIWKFPIDNEQGLEKEHNVYFAEHVFLDQHLEPWCPQKGPIRHFMELVCVGLSKNPYLTVEAKKEHIEWYRDYFDSKKKLLLEIGALTAKKPKQIS